MAFNAQRNSNYRPDVTWIYLVEHLIDSNRGHVRELFVFTWVAEFWNSIDSALGAMPNSRRFSTDSEFREQHNKTHQCEQSGAEPGQRPRGPTPPPPHDCMLTPGVCAFATISCSVFFV